MDNILKFGQPKNLFGLFPGVARSAFGAGDNPSVGQQFGGKL
jgi:hypothetical protein